jgi:branched-chain amino acid transport system substrate-binding protein
MNVRRKPTHLRKVLAGLVALALVSIGVLAAVPAGAASNASLDASAVSYVKGKGQKATGTPIELGWVNTDSGPTQIPNLTTGVKSAVAYANSKLNGFNGHKINLVTCSISTEEEGQACGAKFANDSNMNVIMEGVVSLGATSFYQAINNTKVVLGTIPVSGSDFNPYPGNASPNVFTLNGGVPGRTAGLIQYTTKYLTPKPKKLALIGVQNPAAVSAANGIIGAFKAAGIDATGIFITPGASDTEVGAAIQAAGGDQADTWFMLANIAVCTSAATYAKTANLNPTVLDAGGCLGAPMQPITGGSLIPKGWIFTDNGANIFQPVGPTGALWQLARKYALKLTGGGDPNPQNTAIAFVEVFNMIRAMNAAGPSGTVDQIAQQFRTMQEPIVNNLGPIKCGSNPQTPTLCGTQVGVVQGVGTKVTALKRISPSKAVPAIQNAG